MRWRQGDKPAFDTINNVRDKSGVTRRADHHPGYAVDPPFRVRRIATDSMAWIVDHLDHAGRMGNHVQMIDSRLSQTNADNTVSGDHAGKWRQHPVFQFFHRREVNHCCLGSAGGDASIRGVIELFDPARGDNAARLAGDCNKNGRRIDCSF